MERPIHVRVCSRREALKLTGIVAAVAGGAALVGCSSSTSSASSAASSSAAAAGSASVSAASESANASATSTSAAGSSAANSASAALASSALNIYCGAGMTDPFQEIADAFTEQTGCKMNITFANAAQIQTQIQTTEEGDFFIAGSADELKPVESYVQQSEDLVKHIPVIAVPTANPKKIAALADLANVDTLLIGDPESTPIGKIAKKALNDAGIWEDLQSKNAITTTTTAPQIATALASGEGDAGIVWKENVKADGATIVDTKDMDSYVKTVPAALLTCVSDAEAANEFLDFLDTDAAKAIWQKYGYELV